jgi:hypothetical protein
MTKAVYEYVWEEIEIPHTEYLAPQGVWDRSKWDRAVWSSQFAWGSTQLHGASGMGRSVAIAVKGSSLDPLRLVSFDVIWKTGGAI